MLRYWGVVCLAGRSTHENRCAASGFVQAVQERRDDDLLPEEISLTAGGLSTPATASFSLPFRKITLMAKLARLSDDRILYQ